MYEGVFMRQTPIPNGIIGQEVLERLRWRYEKQRPKVLYGVSTVISAFASYIQERGIRHRPQVVIATGEVLTNPNRRLIESTFRTKPFFYYGRRDVGMIAAECSEHEGIHYHPWGSHVEFDPIGDSQNGMIYRLLVTDLLNYGQPFIRYDTGDCVTLAQQKCSCGKWYPLADQVVGNFSDGVFHPNGTVVPGMSFVDQSPSLKRLPRGIPPLQVAQDSPESSPFGEEIKIHSLSA